MESRVLRLVTAGVMLCLVASCLAGVKESKNWIVLTKDHSFIDLLRERGGAPASLGKRQLILLVRLGAAYEQIAACAQPSADAKSLANSLIRATGIADAIYSQEDDYAAADVNQSSGKLFSKEHRWRIDLGHIAELLRDDGWEVFGGVKIASDVSSKVSAEPIANFGSNSTYSLNSLTMHPIDLEAHLTLTLAILPFVVGFGPMTALAIGFVAAVVVARRKQIDLPRRRKLYAAFVRYPVFGMIGICFPLSMFTIFGGRLMPLTDLWFGTPSAGSSLIPIIFLFMPLPFFLLVTMSRLEPRLFSDNADKADFAPAKTVSLTKTSRTPFLIIAISIALIGFGINTVGIYSGKKGGLRMIFTLVGYGIMFSGAPIAGLITARKNFSKLAQDSDDPLVARAVRIAVAAKTPIASIDVVEPRDQNQIASILFMSGRLTITRKAFVELSEPALDFGIAYALLARPYRLFIAILGFVFPLAGLFAFDLMPTLRRSFPIEQRPLGTFLGMFLIFVPILPFMYWLTRRDAQLHLRDTFRIFPDRSAAKESIEKSFLMNPSLAGPGMRARQQKMLAQVDEVADQMKLP